MESRHPLTLPSRGKNLRLCDEQGGGWLAEIPELPDCIGAGDTIEEALCLVQEAKESLAEVAGQDGEDLAEPVPPVGEYSGKLTLRMPRSLHRRLSQMAVVEGISLNQFILYLLSGRPGERALPERQGSTDGKGPGRHHIVIKKRKSTQI